MLVKFDEFGVTWAFVDPRSEQVRKSISGPDHVDLDLDWELVGDQSLCMDVFGTVGVS